MGGEFMRGRNAATTAWAAFAVAAWLAAGCANTRAAKETAVDRAVGDSQTMANCDVDGQKIDIWDASDAVDVKEPAELPSPPVCPGGSSCPCYWDDHCDIGICLEGRNGRECAAPCGNGVNCPPDSLCVGYMSPAAQWLSICVPRWISLCAPCETDSDCQPTMPVGNPACYEEGWGGSFCSEPCSAKFPCPNGFMCSGYPPHCVSEVGPCGCSDWAWKHGASTTCYESVVGVGACSGVRTCSNRGPLQPCNAETPFPEVCNGYDDNCDGITDNPIQVKLDCTDFDPCTVDACVAGSCSHRKVALCGDGVCSAQCGEAAAGCPVDCPGK